MDPHTGPERPVHSDEVSEPDAAPDLDSRRARRRRRWQQPPVPETRVDRLIREARERGDFDDLPGLGQPLDLRGLDDPEWWAKKKIRDEGLDSSALLPATLQLRRERQEYPESLRDIRSEESVRRILVDFNRRVKRERLAPSLGPASRIVVPTIDIEDMVERWRALPR
ncbi:hypothetical protein GCM10007298_42100 [Williamsia phyllosphaerae]|uniref:DnaJ homologue subfamily C member 28 conserved domain-containing protein n=1 Tax=Williamsia phyllosphaerae TaxID=885042 RepID=A0ABQ1V791_9NOCA|nr:hypothetical protein GCM10007298_42100 [Williamsia phyllosphaerae]